uniref:DUF1015 domain-containing protein n=1 Tax=candidate division WOR-3 bacterium TaxID=2052148 RepID=A0A7C4Y5G6_UNCW3
MAIVKPFKAYRPKKDIVRFVAAPPYDVLEREDAYEIAKDNPYSYLHISKPEIDLPKDVDIYDEKVYLKGKENLMKFINDGILQQDTEPYFYIYRQIWGSHIQTGIVGCASCEDYEKDIIKKHEQTREDKEIDRTRHIETLNAHDEPVFLTYIKRDEINKLVDSVVKNEPEYDFTTDDGIRHILWVVRDFGIVKKIEDEFKNIDTIYVADGHHRSAAAVRLKNILKSKNKNHTGNEEYNFFLSVIFPHNEMKILPYNRVVKDLYGKTKDEFLEEIKKIFEIEERDNPVEPDKKHTFGMYIDKRWYLLKAKESIIPYDAVGSLDVSILQENVLSKLLGIENPRKDKRIYFVGGIKGVKELMRLVDSGEYKVSFSLYPTTIEDIMRVSGEGKFMPPKSTWFEPKLRSGLFVHTLF